MKNLKAPRKALTGLDAETVASLLTAAADVVLVLDRRGIVRDIAVSADDLSAALGEDWVGRSFLDTVTVDSRPKVERLLAEAQSPAAIARQVNHADVSGGTVPVLYHLRGAGEEGRLVALGRDLRPLAALQQRLIEAEQSLEQDYSRLRLAETRYRWLLQSVDEPIITVDPSSQKVLELNAAAQRVIGEPARRAAGRSVAELLGAPAPRALTEWFATLRNSGRADELRVRLAGAAGKCRLIGALFRQDNVSQALLRLVPLATTPLTVASGLLSARLAEVVRRLPDALVITSLEGRIESANRAFLDLVQLASEEQLRGEFLERWLGRPGVDLGVLLGNLREHGSVRLFATQLRGEYGSSADVEISAVLLGEGAEPCIGFLLRNIDRRRAADGRGARELPRSVEQLTELVGRVSLKELVRETTDVIERLCIEAALELTRDNRASAAEMLGLSRQSLYVKLRRYGLGDLAPEGEGR